MCLVQILMNAWKTLIIAIPVLHAPTRLAASTVHVIQATLEVGYYVMVSVLYWLYNYGSNTGYMYAMALLKYDMACFPFP